MKPDSLPAQPSCITDLFANTHQHQDVVSMVDKLQRWTGRIMNRFSTQQQQRRQFSNILSGGLWSTYCEDTVDGLENAPQAFIGLLEGENFGRLVVRVSKD